MNLFDLPWSDRRDPKAPKRLWRRGNHSNFMELWKDPEGKFFYKIRRSYGIDCKRCLEKNYRAFTWTAQFTKGVDPLTTLSGNDLNFSCSRCQEVLVFNGSLGDSEYFGG